MGGYAPLAHTLGGRIAPRRHAPPANAGLAGGGAQ